MQAPGTFDVVEAYERLSAMQALVADVLSELVQLPHSRLDEGIDMALARLGEFCSADRVYVFSYRGSYIVNTHEWCAPGIRPEIDNLQHLSSDSISFWMDNFLAGRYIYLPDVPAIPAYRPERDVLMEQSILSLLAVPMLSGGELIGFVGFDAVRAHRTYLDGEISLLRSVCDVITAAVVRRDAHEKLAYQATHDPLTGLPNRVLLTDRLNQAAARAARNNTCVGLLLLDLDRFKLINDGLGHGMGDRLLQEVANRLVLTVRDVDTVARFGGDEFVIVVADITDPMQLESVAARLHGAFNEPVRIDDFEFYITLSIGVAFAPGKGLNPGDLIMRADTAMYEAKENGRNRHVEYDVMLSRKVSRRSTLIQRLKKSIDNDQIFCKFQPLVDLVTGRCIAVETLARWEDAELGPVGPDEFIPVAEETGLIRRLGERMLWNACERAVRIPELMYVSVNLSPVQLADRHLDQIVSRVLVDSGCPADRLCLEITESTVMGNATEAPSILQKLRKLGVRVALDDFGTGHSSLAVLRFLPIDILKIDRSFVSGMCDQDPDARLVRAVISLARDFALTTVAEGVEHQRQAETLRALGCDIGQGWLYARPMTGGELETWLTCRAEAA